MAGLNDLVTDVKTEATTLPSWYSTAQQNVVNQALGAQSPTVGQTVAQGGINMLQGAQNPYIQGQNVLSSIGSGAANPWLVSDTGEVTPNVNTAMGGLFGAQQDYFKKIMPDIEAGATAPFIGSGGFGGAMNRAAVTRETGKAYSDLVQKQMQAALQNQQTGVAAGTGLGNVGQQAIQSAINMGTYQQNAPYASALNQANILSKMGQQPSTITKTDKLGALNQVMGLLAAGQGMKTSLLGGYVLDPKTGQPKLDAAGNPIRTGGLLGQFGIKGGLSGLYPGVNVSGSGTQAPGWETNAAGGTYDPESGQWYYQDPSTGETIGMDASGNYYNSSGEMIYSPGWDSSNWDTGSSGLDTSGGDTSFMDNWGA